MAINVTTQARVKALRADSHTASDDMIDRLIGDMSVKFEQYMDRLTEAPVAARTEVLDVDYDGQEMFATAAFPITSITSIKYDADRGFGSTIDALESTAYTTRDQWLIIDGAALSKRAQSLQVIYNGGMALNTAAFIAAFPLIATAADTQIVYELTQRFNEGTQSESAGGWNITYPPRIDLLFTVARDLDHYKRQQY